MTYRDSDALCLPARPPQHAAPVNFLRRRPADHLGVFGRLRRLTRQALQLFVTVIAWATGLGLVIGSIVLVATVTAPRQSPAIGAHQDANSAIQRKIQDGEHQAGVGHRTGSSRSGPVRGRYQVVAAFSGRGNQITRHFTVRARQRWQVRWTYRCAEPSDAGPADTEFMLLRADIAAADEAAVSTAAELFAASGHGSVWLSPGSHQLYLVVISACSWHIRVMQAA